MPSTLRLTARAKLNLYLHITGRRADGYHLLDSLMAFSAFGDVLEITPGDTLRLDIAGPLAAGLQEPADNLILRAARLLQKETGVSRGAHITLHKYIPIGAGLGGGSADAAAALRGLRTLWQLDIDDAKLQMLSLSLGSDVPVCVPSQAAYVRGVGEQVAPVALPAGVWAVLANPGVPLLTAEVYRAFSGDFDVPMAAPSAISSPGALIELLRTRHNALQPPAITLCPVITDVLAALEHTHCLLARMSGSGATCFALYKDETSARRAAAELQQAHPAWWLVATELCNAQEPL